MDIEKVIKIAIQEVLTPRNDVKFSIQKLIEKFDVLQLALEIEDWFWLYKDLEEIEKESKEIKNKLEDRIDLSVRVMSLPDSAIRPYGRF